MGIQQTSPLTWLAETKFHPPLLLDDLTPRQRLLADLHRALASHPLTLLSAPAGYGKTTLLAALPSTCPDLSLAWLSLDEADNDPVRFLTAMIVALQHLDPDCGAASVSLLTGQTSPGFDVRQVISVLINDVLEALSAPFALVLDDLHRITRPSIFVALDYLLEHLPPQMHLVVASRTDPPLALARLRARGQLSELRLVDLCFTAGETAAFLNDRMALDLSPDEVGVLQARTEGWPVGLRLLAGSLSRLPAAADRSAFIQHLVNTSRYVFDFLAEEVLNLQEPAVREFLLQTAILPELTPRLCQAITARADAGDLLEDLFHRNIFLVATGIRSRGKSTPSLAPQPSYRYHDLFAEFLRQKLGQELPERITELHLRAARAESDPARAVSHYLAASRWDAAARVIEEIGSEMFNRGYLDTLSRWINALPPHVRDSRPRLLHYLSNCAVWKGEWQEAQSLLERALQGFQAAGDESGQGETLANLASLADWTQSNSERSEVLLDQALTYPLPYRIRVHALLDRASLKLTWGDWSQAERDFNAAMRIQQSQGLDVLHLYTLPVLDPAFAFLPGGLEHLESINNQAQDQVGSEVSPLRLVVEEMATVLHLFQGHLAEAIHIGQSALDLRQRLGGHPFLAMDAAFFLIIAHAARGDYAAVESLFDLLFLGVTETSQPEGHMASALFVPGRIRWLQGRLQEAREIYAHMCAVEDSQREIPSDRISRAWMSSLLEMADGNYRGAEFTLRQPEVLEQNDRYSTINGSTRLMLARLYWRQDLYKKALAELAPVLAYHEQLGIPFPILLEGQSILPLLQLAIERGIHKEYASHLLALMSTDGRPHPVEVPDTGETLTPREVEVLRQIAQGASNRTIAQRLVITESTVKTHIYHIFAKLDVSSRTEAAVRSRELRLL